MSTLAAILLSASLIPGGVNGSNAVPTESNVPLMRAATAPDLPDPCGLVTDDEVSALLWKGMEAGQRTSLQAKKAKYVFTKRVEDVANPPGRTCHVSYKVVAGDRTWSEGDFKLRTLARQTFDIFAQSSPKKQKPIAGVGDQAFYMSNAAYGRRGNVGIEIVEFSSKDLEIELLKTAVKRLP